VWPEIISSIKDSGIVNMEIYRLHARLFMVMDINESFSFEKKAAADDRNKKVQEWEALMWKYQDAVEGAAAGTKWVLMDKIFDLKEF
jgi:L-rhamnose mutarotase